MTRPNIAKCTMKETHTQNKIHRNKINSHLQCISVQILEKVACHNLEFPFKLQLLFKALEIS